MITGLGALAALGAANADALVHAGSFTQLVAAAAALGLALMGAGVLWRLPLTSPWAVLLTAAAYLVGREGSPVVDGGAAVVGVLLLVAAELASWSIGEDPRIRAEPSLVLRRALTIGALVAGALVLDVLLLGAAAISSSSGIALAAVGVTAAVGAMVVVVRLVRG